ncbi:hypothetical protein [Laspinema olomoucense]|nr:hypothetical protein [Laspinema sp. D3b]
MTNFSYFTSESLRDLAALPLIKLDDETVTTIKLKADLFRGYRE